MNLLECAVISDFDGTITELDSNDLLFKLLGNAENAQIEKDFHAGILSGRSAMERHFEILRISMEEYHAFLDANIRPDPAFGSFLRQIKACGLALFIVSAGFRQAIMRTLKQECLDCAGFYANDLAGAPYLMPVFAQSAPVCSESFGPCGNCKKACVAAIRKQTGKRIIYIGDGLTDRCAAHAADYLFAKNELAQYCRANGLPFIEYKDFSDIVKLFWKKQEQK